jgi:hypothetical protein
LIKEPFQNPSPGHHCLGAPNFFSPFLIVFHLLVLAARNGRKRPKSEKAAQIHFHPHLTLESHIITAPVAHSSHLIKALQPFLILFTLSVKSHCKTQVDWE